MHLKTSLILFLLILASFSESKRSRGRSRGSSGSSSSFWTRKSKSSTETKPIETKPINQPKPSAPKEPEIKKQTANIQQNSPQNSRPIGWDTQNIQKQNVNPSYTAPNPHGVYPQNTGGYAGHGQQPIVPNPHGVYPQNTGGYAGYGQQPIAPNPHGVYPQNTGGYTGYGQQPIGGYQNQGYGTHQDYNYGNMHNPQGFPGQNPGQYPNMMGGPGYGNYPQMPHQQQTGLMGSMFGGKKHGFGGYGGYGYGYGMKKSGGFFGKHAFRNVLGGLFVWYLVSGLVSRPYKVYNFYNQPKEVREEITLPANVLTLCNENATNICVPGTTAICTQDNQILCVMTMSSTSPCQNNTGELCVNSTIPCVDANDPLCQNNTTVDNTTTVSVPCFTNMTIETDRMGLPPNVTLPSSENNKFCVTTMAVPDPSLPPEEGTAAVPTDNTSLAPNITLGFNATMPITV